MNHDVTSKVRARKRSRGDDNDYNIVEIREILKKILKSNKEVKEKLNKRREVF